MRVSGDEFSKRLRGYADSTIQMLMQITGKDKELESLEIVATTETEQEVIQKLKKLKERNS